MKEVIILVEDSDEGRKKFEQIANLIENSELRGTIVLPGYIKKPT